MCVFNFWCSLLAALILFKLKSFIDRIIIVYQAKWLINQSHALKVCLHFDIGSFYLNCVFLV